MRRKWTDVEIKQLTDNVHLTALELSLLLNRDLSTIRRKLSILNLPYIKHKFNNVEMLLENTNISAYWIGLLLADGWVDHRSISIQVSERDEKYISAYAKYIGVKVNKYTKDTNFKENYTCCSVTASNDFIVPKICFIYDIKRNKSTNPPDFKLYKLTDEQWISLFIGFIDGDGSIYRTKTKYNKINIQVHPSWKENLEILNTKIHQILNESSKSSVGYINNGTVALCLSKNSIIQKLLQCARKYDLPILKRKWSKII